MYNIEYLDERLYEMLELHFCADCDEDKNFLEYLKLILNTHEKESERHKRLYFEKNSQNFKNNSFFNLIIGIFSKFNNISLFHDIVLLFFTIILNNFLLKFKISYFLIVFIIGFLLLLVCNYYISKLTIQTKELKLDRHSETWVRHECAYQNLKIEIITYINLVGIYNGKNSNEAKKIFKKSIIDLYKQDINQFQNNMKKSEEIIK